MVALNIKLPLKEIAYSPRVCLLNFEEVNVVELFLSSIHVVAYLIEYDMKDSIIEKVRYLMGK